MSSFFTIFLALPLLINFSLDTSIITPLFCLTSLSSPLILLTLLLLPLIILASQKIYLNLQSPQFFIFLLVILTLVLLICFSVSNIFSFYILFELSLIPTALLIICWGYQPERVTATIYLLLYTITFSLPLLLAIINFSSKVLRNSFSLSSFIYSSYSSPFLITLCFIFAFLVKLPIFLLHLWLPKAHVEAPVAGSIILAGVLLKLGSYGLLRIIPIAPLSQTNLPLLLVTLSLIGAVVTSLICTQQTDIKRLIAYASVAHIGLLLVGTLLLSTWGWTGAILIMIAHGIASSGLFALANYSYIITQTRNIFIIKGLLSFVPAISLWWFIFLALNLAAPPSLNFAREIFLITATLPTIRFSAFPIIIIIILSAAYSIILYTSLNHGQSSSFLSPTLSLPLTLHPTIIFHLFPLLILVLFPSLLSPY